MNKTNVLHIASFNGNIGDNANHNGLRKKLNEIFKGNISFDNIEMREFYKSWNVREFNSLSFINLCNSYDLVIIGGGNFFELKWDYSETGTTVNLSDSTLKKIHTPILFFGLGCDIAKGASSESIQKFDNFLNNITNSDQFLVTVRNDGSYKTIEGLYGEKYKNKVLRVPDGAFFFEADNVEFSLENNNRKNIGINVACDMKLTRFNKEISYDNYVNDFADFLNIFLHEHEEFDLIFFPHIYSDLEAISDVLNQINDQFRRYRISVAPYLTGLGSDKYIFGLYKKCSVILGMRFHSNVCAVAQNIPTVALGSYKKINDLHEEIGLLERVVNINETDFGNELRHRLNDTLINLDNIQKQYSYVNLKINNLFNEFEETLQKWIKIQKIKDGLN